MIVTGNAVQLGLGDRLVRPVGSAGGHFALQVGKRCLFEIKAISNNAFYPRICTLLPVETGEESGSRCKRCGQRYVRGFDLTGMEGFSPSLIVVCLSNDYVVNFTLA